MNKNINILLTGGTGILGSHILFELIPQYVTGLLCGKIVLIVRSNRKHSAEQRVSQMLTSTGIPEKIKKIPVGEILRHIELIDSDLQHFSREKLPDPQGGYTVIHAASSVNLSQMDETKDALLQNNYVGTVRFINEILPVTQKFVFISTAYSSGHRIGAIDNDFFQHNGFNFRNPYEYFKHQTEIYIRDTFSVKGVDWQILRPSIICGRLMEPPLYAIPRFLVFYLFARYILNFKSRINNQFIRFHVPEQAAINIVPVDYVAKVVVSVIEKPINQLNIVHARNVSCRALFKQGFELINFNNYSFCNDWPESLNPVERLLHSTIGRQLGPYIDSPAHYFDTTTLQTLCPELVIPEIDTCFAELLTFAANQKFTDLY